MPRALLVERDTSARLDIRSFLVGHGVEVTEADTFENAEKELRKRPPDVIVVDSEIPVGVRGEIVPMLKRIDERVPIILVTATSGLDQAVRAVKQGAEHLIAKPIDLPSLLVIVKRILDTQRTRRREIAISVREQRRGLDPFAGRSAAIQKFSDEAHRVLDSHAPILIQGETGTGKGVLAAWLHHHGPRAEEAFVDINCASFSKELLESELFGHERGAFTGATSAKIGLFDVAHRGTAFLDEIGEIDLALQPRLLKVLEEKRFRRLGDVRDHVVDLRLIAATNRDLARRSREGSFRADLYYRINTVALVVPSLRERREDIPILARSIASSLGHDFDFTSEALRAMEAYDWPGNLRELRNVIERAILMNRASRITPNDLRFETTSTRPNADTRDFLPRERDTRDILQADPDFEQIPDEMLTLDQAERRHIERVLRFENGSVERAASRLGISRSTLYQKLRRIREQRVS